MDTRKELFSMMDEISEKMAANKYKKDYFMVELNGLCLLEIFNGLIDQICEQNELYRDALDKLEEAYKQIRKLLKEIEDQNGQIQWMGELTQELSEKLQKQTDKIHGYEAILGINVKNG